MDSNTSRGDGANDEEEEEIIVSVTEKGQATIPKLFREHLGIGAPGKVKFRRNSRGAILVEPVTSATRFRGALSAEGGKSGTHILREDREKEKKEDEEEFSRFLNDE